MILLLFKICCLLLTQNVISAYTIPDYDVRAITPPGISLESPQWSTEENVLYYVDNFGQKIHRYDPCADELTTKHIDLGFVGFVIPVKGYPGKLIVGINACLYFLNWSAEDNDSSLKLLTVVDLGKPKNVFDDAKVDANGNLWCGTFVADPSFNIEKNKDKATFYMINQYNFKNPEVKLRPVSVSNGIAWSLDNKKMYYNDSPTKVVSAFDFDLKNSELANRTDFFKFADYPITGIPDGMTRDSDGNLWVATASGASILHIDGKTGVLREQIVLPVELVTSLMWGGKDLDTLFVTTARQLDTDNPRKQKESSKPLSGTLMAITNLGTKGVPENMFVFNDADQY